MIGISFHHKGDFRKTDKFFDDLLDEKYLRVLEKYGRLGCQMLAAYTPRRSGKTAASWTYDIERKPGQTSIVFSNTNINKGVNIAVILQYGHGTRNGGYVSGIDYINPAIIPVFDDISKNAWEEVKNL